MGHPPSCAMHEQTSRWLAQDDVMTAARCGHVAITSMISFVMWEESEGNYNRSAFGTSRDLGRTGAIFVEEASHKDRGKCSRVFVCLLRHASGTEGPRNISLFHTLGELSAGSYLQRLLKQINLPHGFQFLNFSLAAPAWLALRDLPWILVLLPLSN